MPTRFAVSSSSLSPAQRRKHGPWTNDAARIAYPVPQEQSLIVSGASPAAWPALTAPGLVGIVTPADGMHRVLLPGAINQSGWAVYSGNAAVDHASPCMLSNGWDDAGELIRLPRRDGENDFVYAGRQQRLWLSAVFNGAVDSSPGAATKYGQERSLSAALGQSVFIDSWDGTEFAALDKTTHVDPLDYPDILKNTVMSLQAGDVFLSTPTTLVCSQDLHSYKRVHLRIAEFELRRGVDYVLDETDGTKIYLAAPMDPATALDVIGQDRLPLRLTQSDFFQDDFITSVLPEPARTSGSWTGPLLLSRGPRALTAGNSLYPLLIQPGMTLPTFLGQSITETPITPSWKSLPLVGVPMTSPPFDLDTGVFV